MFCKKMLGAQRCVEFAGVMCQLGRNKIVREGNPGYDGYYCPGNRDLASDCIRQLTPFNTQVYNDVYISANKGETIYTYLQALISLSFMFNYVIVFQEVI